MIRAAREGDAAAIAAIYAVEVLDGTATFELVPPDAAVIARRMTAGGGSLPWLVRERAGAVLGYAYASPYGSARPMRGRRRPPFMSRAARRARVSGGRSTRR